MKALPLLLTLALCHCKEPAPKSKATAPIEPLITSKELQKNFPLLPLIEARLWKKLTTAETQGNQTQIAAIASQLQQLHPFENTETTINLGGISYHKSDKTITIPASVNYPAGDDNRHPQEIELILCSNQGRTHETLFTTEVNPLHLELLLHLAGFKKAPHASAFRLDIKSANLEPIPVRELLQTTERTPLASQALTWEFSGSDFSHHFYSPESTGDLIICWHVHDSVLRITNPQIASSEIKLLPRKSPYLQQAEKVELILSPLYNKPE